MTELHIPLTLASLERIAKGKEVVLQVSDMDLQIVLYGDEETVEVFRQRMHLALMQALPTPPSMN